MSNVVLLKPTPLAATKAKWDQADSASEQAEQLYIEIGRELKEHKESKPKDIPWPDYVRQNFDRSQQRADELIRLANGKTTVASLREEARERMATVRARRSTERSVGFDADGEAPLGNQQAIVLSRPSRGARSERVEGMLATAY